MKLRMSLSLCVVVLSLLCAADVSAKRMRAPDVTPVVHEGIRYIAPNDDGRRAYVQAWDTVTTNKLWEVTVFMNRINPMKEKDVQWIFIKRLQIENGKLVVTDEGVRQFVVDLKTKKVEQR